MLTSCNQNLTIKDVVITERLFSPDSSYVVLTYYKDNGAMGESSSMTSILKTEDTLGQLNKSMLPCFDLSFYSCYYPDQWLDNKTLQVNLNERPFVKEGIPFDSSSFTINGINCKVVPADYSYSLTPLIEYFSFANDRKKILVAYRYKGDLNISAINYGDELPRIGNVFTNTEISFNPIRYVRWNENSIDMFLKDAEMYNTSDYVNKKTPYIVNFVDISQLKETYKSNDYFAYFPLYKDDQIDNLLKTNGITTKATITESQWSKDGDKSLFYYQYEYEVTGQKYRSYFRIFKDFEKGADYEIGDLITIKYDPKQPFIHKPDKNYSR
ncbi:MAG TPA: hypothetical protein P5228_07630 [Bacteroidales bacterium]|nr:hypothetical protein [Bacteroidales bacterium]